MAETPRFEFELDPDVTLGSRLLIGFGSPGMSSLVATDHLTTELDASEVGHATASGLATVTPFTDGKPRYATRLYDTGEDLSLLVSEVLLPAPVGELLGDAILALADDHGIEEITLLYGASYPHGPEQHAVFSVSTDAYPTERVVDHGVKPLSGGFLDGLVGGLLEDGINDETPAVGVLVTPGHPPGPDFDAALLFMDAVCAHYDIDVDRTELEERSEEVDRYYAELADRMGAVQDEGSRDWIDDRMYM
jgi:uncharacterized protein